MSPNNAVLSILLHLTYQHHGTSATVYPGANYISCQFEILSKSSSQVLPVHWSFLTWNSIATFHTMKTTSFTLLVTSHSCTTLFLLHNRNICKGIFSVKTLLWAEIFFISECFIFCRSFSFWRAQLKILKL